MRAVRSQSGGCEPVRLRECVVVRRRPEGNPVLGSERCLDSGANEHLDASLSVRQRLCLPESSGSLSGLLGRPSRRSISGVGVRERHREVRWVGRIISRMGERPGIRLQPSYDRGKAPSTIARKRISRKSPTAPATRSCSARPWAGERRMVPSTSRVTHGWVMGYMTHLLGSDAERHRRHGVVSILQAGIPT